MSKYATDSTLAPNKPIVPKWSIRDTEFLIRLIMSSKIDGTDLEVASSVVKKVKELHTLIIEHQVVI